MNAILSNKELLLEKAVKPISILQQWEDIISYLSEKGIPFSTLLGDLKVMIKNY